MAAAPSEAWIDPAFAAAAPWRGCTFLSPLRATAWFDRQLLPDGTSYAAQTEAWAAEPRRALRGRVVAELKALSATSYAAAAPALEQLEAEGAVADCAPHWIVNAVTCTLTGGDPEALAAVPGVSAVFRRPSARPSNWRRGYTGRTCPVERPAGERPMRRRSDCRNLVSDRGSPGSAGSGWGQEVR
jgi:hypothetical protein